MLFLRFSAILYICLFLPSYMAPDLCISFCLSMAKVFFFLLSLLILICYLHFVPHSTWTELCEFVGAFPISNILRLDDVWEKRGHLHFFIEPHTCARTMLCFSVNCFVSWEIWKGFADFQRFWRFSIALCTFFD
jgi:hypothetical protein